MLLKKPHVALKSKLTKLPKKLKRRYGNDLGPTDVLLGTAPGSDYQELNIARLLDLIQKCYEKLKLWSPNCDGELKSTIEKLSHYFKTWSEEMENAKNHIECIIILYNPNAIEWIWSRVSKLLLKSLPNQDLTESKNSITIMNELYDQITEWNLKLIKHYEETQKESLKAQSIPISNDPLYIQDELAPEYQLFIRFKDSSLIKNSNSLQRSDISSIIYAKRHYLSEPTPKTTIELNQVSAVKAKANSISYQNQRVPINTDFEYTIPQLLKKFLQDSKEESLQDSKEKKFLDPLKFLDILIENQFYFISGQENVNKFLDSIADDSFFNLKYIKSQ